MTAAPTGYNKLCLLASCLALIEVTACKATPKTERLWPAMSSFALSSRSRTIRTPRWDTLATLTPLKRDRDPTRFVALTTGFAYYDNASGELVRFDAAGKERGTSASINSANDGLSDVRDVRTLPHGRIAILDARRGELVIFSSNLASAKHIQLRQQARVEQFVPVDSGRFFLWTFDTSAPFVQVDSMGTAISGAAFPWGEYKQLHPLVRDGILATGDSYKDWAFAFVSGDGWVPLGVGTHTLQPYIESVAFPPVLERTFGNRTLSHIGRFTSSALSAVVDRGVLFVLFGGKSQLHGRIIDRYRVSDGQYLGSLIAPIGSHALATNNGKLLVFTLDTLVHVVKLGSQL